MDTYHDMTVPVPHKTAHQLAKVGVAISLSLDLLNRNSLISLYSTGTTTHNLSDFSLVR